MAKRDLEEVLQDEDFKRLVKKKTIVSTVFTLLELLLYFGFIGLIAYNKPFLSQKISEGSAITIGIPIAVLTILFSWILTAIYIFWANSSYDRDVKRVKDKIGGK